MADYDLRLPLNFEFGTLSVSVTNSGTTLSSPGFQDFPTNLSTTKYVPLALVDDTNSLYELVWVTGHALDSADVTVVRGREGTLGRAWPSGTIWRVSASVRDTLTPVADADRPADAHIGMRIISTDDSKEYIKTASGWTAFPQPDPAMKIGDIVLASAASSVTFSSIPQNYDHLRLVIRSGASASALRQFTMRLNGLSTAGYDFQGIYSGSGVVNGFHVNATTYMEVGNANRNADGKAVSEIFLADYADSTNAKFSYTTGAYSTGAGGLNVYSSSGLCWGQTSAVTSITIGLTGDQLQAGSHFTLYGIR